MTRRFYIGIDPGSKGYACFHSTDDGQYHHVPLADTDRMIDLLNQARASGNCIALIEQVGAMPGQGLSSTFMFGQNTGITLGLLIATGIPYVRVTPAKWQHELWDAADKVYRDRKVDTKKTSANAARRLHPGMDFRRTEKCTSTDDNKVDATLICDYAERMNL